MPRKDLLERKGYQREYSRTQYNTNQTFRENHIERMSRYREAKRNLISEAKRAGCTRCGECTEDCLALYKQIDGRCNGRLSHRDSKREIIEWLPKSIVLCRNCYLKVRRIG
jgi:hypothetical protein